MHPLIYSILKANSDKGKVARAKSLYPPKLGRGVHAKLQKK